MFWGINWGVFKESYFSGFSILLDWKTGRVAELFRAGFLWVDR